ncbi:MAG: hypothetical protein ABI488_06500 [Polyangiaceae bacterium]
MIPTLSACAPAAGGAVLVGVVAISALTSHCYDYLDVSVFDAQGRKTCAATVTASSGSDHFELGSCYYAPLTDGVWTVRAALPGFPDAVTTVPVVHAHDCTRYVQSVELTLKPTQPPRSVPPPPELRRTPQTPAPAASIPEADAPSASPAAIPPPAAMPSAVPSASGTPPVGVFPNSP